MKIYGWTEPIGTETAFLLGDERWHCQARAFVAAKSMADVARLVGERYARNLHCLQETGNDEEIATAMSKPGTVFLRSMQGGRDKPVIEMKQR